MPHPPRCSVGLACWHTRRHPHIALPKRPLVQFATRLHEPSVAALRLIACHKTLVHMRQFPCTLRTYIRGRLVARSPGGRQQTGKTGRRADGQMGRWTGGNGRAGCTRRLQRLMMQRGTVPRINNTKWQRRQASGGRPWFAFQCAGYDMPGI